MKIVKTSEWDARAIIAYAQIHNYDRFNMKLKDSRNTPIKKIDEYLKSFVFSLNSKAPGNPLRKDENFRRNLYAANIVNNNLPDITKVEGKEIDGIDLLTYSFPCQGLSIANMGRDQGIKETSESTSNLLWEVRRILLDAEATKVKLPRFLLMENVKNLLSKKHKDDYKKWLKFLKELGYSTGTIVVNGLNHNSLQKRERVFALSILDGDLDDKKFEGLLSKKSNALTSQERKKKYLSILKKSPESEISLAIPNNTPSRKKMAKENHNLLDRKWVSNREYTFNTLTTKQDRHPNIGMIKLDSTLKGKLSHRFITPREGYMIMGFESSDYSRVHKKFREGILTKESLYRQAGNSIVVTVLEDIFKVIDDFKGGKYV